MLSTLEEDTKLDLPAAKGEGRDLTAGHALLVEAAALPLVIVTRHLHHLVILVNAVDADAVVVEDGSRQICARRGLGDGELSVLPVAAVVQLLAEAEVVFLVVDTVIDLAIDTVVIIWSRIPNLHGRVVRVGALGAHASQAAAGQGAAKVGHLRPALFLVFCGLTC